MYRKMHLRSEIKRSKNRIEELEKKRSRSQAALVAAILAHTEPNDEDVDYFNGFTKEIDAEREKLRALIAQYEQL